ncbi:MAG: DUF4249 family protein [Rikenellaceae bacterium]
MKRLLVIFSIFALWGCEKQIDINYRSIEPLYVIEGNVCAAGSQIIVTQTRDMDDAQGSVGVDDAWVVVSDSLGVEYEFVSVGGGVYEPREPMVVMDNSDYELLVEVGDERFWATSRVYSQPYVTPLNLTQQTFMDVMTMVFCSFSIYEQPDQADYYRYRLTVNSTDSNWVLVSDLGVVNNMLFLFQPLIKKENDELVDVVDGDTIKLEVQTIDKYVYDYFNSLDLSADNGSNPISNIEGGCLGYFSAHTISTAISYLDFADVN